MCLLFGDVLGADLWIFVILGADLVRIRFCGFLVRICCWILVRICCWILVRICCFVDFSSSPLSVIVLEFAASGGGFALELWSRGDSMMKIRKESLRITQKRMNLMNL